MNKSNDIIPRVVFALVGFGVCLLCLMLFGIPEYHGLLNSPKEPVVQIEPTSSDPAPVVETPGKPYVHPLAAELFDMTNDIRMSAGLGVLTYAYELQEQADTRAYECSVQFSHTRPDGSSCHDIVTKDYYVTGENLILVDKPIASAENIMARWMLSKG